MVQAHSESKRYDPNKSLRRRLEETALLEAMSGPCWRIKQRNNLLSERVHEREGSVGAEECKWRQLMNYGRGNEIFGFFFEITFSILTI